MPREDHKKLISIVIPAYNESSVIEAFYGKLRETIDSLSAQFEWEVIFVNDGSTDKTLEIFKVLRANDPQVKWLSLSRNFGHQAALTAGMEHAQGDAVIMMDCDLQHPVSLIPEMIRQWEHGFDIVQTIREDSNELGFVKKITSKIFYCIINTLGRTTVRASAADFRLISRKAVDAFNRFSETHRFIRGMVSWMGFSTFELAYKPEGRFAGKSKYTIKKMFNLALDGITSFSIVPLRISTLLGTLIFFGTLIYAVYAIIIWFIKPETLQIGWTSLLVTLNLLGGAILLFIGLIGEYIGRIYEQVKMRPLYLVDTMEGFKENHPRKNDD